MRYKITEIVRDVCVQLGESPRRAAMLSADERAMTIQIDEIVVANVADEAAEAVLRTDRHRLEEVTQIVGVQRRLSGNSGEIVLPADYLRLVEFRMPDWTRSVYRVAAADSLRAILGDEAPEWLNTPNRPLLIYGGDTQGTTLRYYGTELPESTPHTALYAPRPQIWPDDTIEIPRSEYRQVVRNLVALIRAL